MELAHVRYQGSGLVRLVPRLHQLCQGYVLQGTSLNPVPPGGSGKDARWIDIREGELEEAEEQLAKWIQQAAAIPGWGKS
jgi:hypothetical protein